MVSTNALITCGGSLQFHFRHCANISIEDLAFGNCGLDTLSASLQLFPFPRPCSTPRAALQFYNIDSLLLHNIDVRYSHGYGVFAVNILRKLSIIGCNFQQNLGSSRNPYSDDNTTMAHGGNVLILYHNILLEEQLQHSLEVTSSVFKLSNKFNDVTLECNIMDITQSCNFVTCSSSGLAIIVIPGIKEYYVFPSKTVNISITQSVFQYNRAYNGGNLMIAFLANKLYFRMYCTVLIQQCKFLAGEAINYGGGLYIYHDMAGSFTTIDIFNSSFVNNEVQNTGGGLALAMKQSYDHSSKFNITLALCSIHSNYARYLGGGVSVTRNSDGGIYQTNIYRTTPQFVASFVNTNFTTNKADLLGGGLQFDVTSTQSSSVLDIAGCTFVNNKGKSGGGIYINHHRSHDFRFTQIALYDSLFDGNYAAENGGHIAMTMQAILEENSTLQKQPKVIVVERCHFNQGRAKKAGAISFTLGCTSKHQNCSVTLEIQHSNFVKNTAELGGAIYLHHILKYYPEHFSIKVFLRQVFFGENHADLGGGIFLDGTQAVSYLTEVFLSIMDCNMSKNYARLGAGIHVSIKDYYRAPDILASYSYVNISINATVLTGNEAEVGSAVSIICDVNTRSIIKVIDSQFYNQVAVEPSRNSAVVYLENVTECYIVQSQFRKNFGSCITANQSSLFISGTVVLSDNKASVGTAIRLDCAPMSLQPSFLNLLPEASLMLDNNTADHYGGALAVNPVCKYDKLCFFQTPVIHNKSTPNIEIMGNIALIAGGGFYGESVDNCTIMEHNTNGHDVFLSLFSLENFTFDQFIMFTEVYTVCFCSKDLRKQLQCSNG